MRILFVASEAAPLVKVGGLADVVGSLPKALRQLGDDVRIIMPKYGVIDEQRFPSTVRLESLGVDVMRRRESARIRETRHGDVPVYLVENARYFGRASVYTENEDLERFLFFSRVVAEFIRVFDWKPELVHCHDWHTSLVPLWLRKLNLPMAVIFTIHNLAYQGPFNDWFLGTSALGEVTDRWPKKPGSSDTTMMSQGILNADIVSTVSETYAKEILTPEYGEGIQDLLRTRQNDLVGIVNGIDHADYDPATDVNIPGHYSAAKPSGKATNKTALQARMKLPQQPGVPLIGMVSRLDEQKGLDIMEKAAPDFVGLDFQLVVLGTGRPQYHQFVSRLAAENPTKVAASLEFNNALAHLIYAGSDIFLMPSSFEPCGLGQLIAMRYGTVPLVRHTGGLVDTVEPLSPDLKKGAGFVFKPYEPGPLAETMRTAVAAFRSRRAGWKTLIPRIMSQDFSWRASAARYQALYRRTIEKRRALP